MQGCNVRSNQPALNNVCSTDRRKTVDRSELGIVDTHWLETAVNQSATRY